MKLSVIIPTYNSESKIDRCIKSVLSQTYSNVEIVIIDGGSSDKTVGIIEGFQKVNSNIVFISESDEGIYDAMNKGINLSVGEWVYFLGSDDTLFSETVFEEFSTKSTSLGSDLIYGSALIVGNPGWAMDQDVYDGEFNVEKLFKKNICQQAIFYKKSVFGKVGYFNITYKVCGDWDFNHRCFAALETSYINFTVAIFNAGGTSTISHKDAYTEHESVINLNKYYQLSFHHNYFKSYIEPLRKASKLAIKRKKYSIGLRLYLAYIYHFSCNKISYKFKRLNGYMNFPFKVRT